MSDAVSRPDIRVENRKGEPREKGFFAIDRRNWKLACDLGLNEAVVYLVMASGTDRKQITTKWSARAVENRVNIHWRKAKAAQTNLIQRNLVRELKGGQHPIYELTPYEVLTGEFQPKRPPLTAEQTKVSDRIAAGENSRLSFNAREQTQLKTLISRRWVKEKRGGTELEVISEEKHAPRRNFIYLPNSIIDGTVKKEIAPIEKLRAGQDVEVLRLFIDLYYGQDLTEDGGIRRDILRKEFHRRSEGTHWGYQLPWTLPVSFVQLPNDRGLLRSHLLAVGYWLVN